MAIITANNINLVQLEEALELDSENLEQLQYWYEQLSELELDGTETSETVELLFRALKWLMQYEHTNAEELKEIAEKEAVEMAEKEENWEQEKEILKEELSLLRERITSKAGTNDMNEAFRAEIDSLKAEINHLKQTGRDRDRELADQQDKNEELTARIEASEKERTLLLQNQSQLEDTIRELNRRITSKSDSSDKDWEARKLKQRSEQAFILSNQLQNAVSQNDHLQTEVERLSSALESATTLIKDTTEKYGTLKEQLSNSEKTIEKLLDENQNLKKQLSLRQSDLVEKIETFEVSAKEVEDLIKQKDNQIEKYKRQLNDQLMEIDEQRARLALVNNDEREAELERLRQELVEATKLARQLFGSMSGDVEIGQSLDPTAELRVRIVQLDKQLEITQQKINELREENKKLEKIAEEKDVINAKINGELERIRKISFGDADDEIKNLERQMRYREEQIEELTTKCSLLQIELQKYEDSPPRFSSSQEQQSSKPKSTTIPKAPPRKGPTIKKPVQRPTITPKPKVEVEQEEETEKKESKKSPPRREITESYLNDVEASAMIISSLNYELMRVLQENEDKERQLKEFEKLTKDHSKDLQLARAKINQLISKYADLKAQSMISLDIGGSNNDEQAAAKDARLQELEIKVIELERLADSIKQDGSEFDRRMEEAARKLIYVQIKNAEYERKIENSERIQKSAVEMTERLRTKLRTLLTGENRKLKSLSRDYELSMIEIARLQNVIIHSAPLTQFEKVLKAYKSLVHKSAVNDEYNIENDPAFEISDQIPNISANFAISNNQSSTIIENLSLKNLEIQEINEILESQNEFFRRENERQQLEINELKAFLTDIENQTELKSLIVNIERRFLQGIQEQADSSDEQYFSEKELRTITKKLTLRKKAWKQERQNLVGIIVGLQNTVNRLKQHTTSVIQMDHLIQIKESAEKLKDKEKNLNEKEETIDKKLSDLSIRESFVESQAGAIKTVMDADFNLQRIQKSIQGYEFNVLALSNELKGAKNEIENLKKQIENNENDLQELKRENNDLLSMKMDFSQFEHAEDESKSEDEGDEKEKREKPQRKKPKRQNSLINQLPRQLSNAYQTTISESEDESTLSTEEPSSASERIERKEKTRTIIYDNSIEYQKQMEQVKERARLCIQSYKDQLEQKDSAIDEYKQLLESLRRQLLEKSIKEIEDEPVTSAEEKPKTSAELLNNVILEEKEREIFALEKEIRKLEDINGELSERLSATTTTTSISQNLEKKNIGCQTERSNESDRVVGNNNNNNSTKYPVVATREQSFDNDFESDSDDTGSDREDSRTPVPPPPPQTNNPSGNPPKQQNEESESESSESESEGGGTTDSGTVEDIEVRPRRPSRSSSRSSSADNNNRRRSSDTITIVKPSPSTTIKPPPPGKRPASTSTITIKPPPLVVAGDDREQVIYGQRNEIRKLRERIVSLEKRARQLETERDSWKERNRFGGKRETDPDAEVTTLRKENERLRRESKNLSRTLENQKHRIDDLEKALTKRNSTLQNKESVENWEEKKKIERTLANLKKRLEEAGIREAELVERLERREKHIEQISREQGGRNYDSDRLQQIVRVLKTEKEGFDQREINMKHEIELWKERGKETMGRLDQSLKENRLLKARLERLSQKVEELEAAHQIAQHPHVPFPSPPKQQQQQHYSPPKPPITIPKHSIHTQTTPIPSTHPSPRETIRYITVPPQPTPLSLPPVSPSTTSRGDLLETIRESPTSSTLEDKAEILKLRKQTRLFELRITELQEEIEETQKRYDNLRESYTKVVRVDRERLKDTEKIAAISVLRDKLVAKDKEIDFQRRRINDLERKIFHFENR
uniref:Uncharacterized protein n=1 Tax=Panagrolaimus sp. PS1159 TaxID=55785 RepID=A0AC35GY19_9BILA